MAAVLDAARRDTEALAGGGANGIIVENFGDAPFVKGRVGVETVAAMTLAACEVRSIFDGPVGINVLRNDARSALAIAHVTGSHFVRVNVHTGVMVADEGLIEGEASETLRYRRNLQADVRIFADVFVKHAVSLGDHDLVRAAQAAVHRGLADGVIVSGAITGEPPSPSEVRAAREAVPDVPVLIGSGLDETNARELLSHADGAIVGTNLKVDGRIENPVDWSRVASLVNLAQTLG